MLVALVLVAVISAAYWAARQDRPQRAPGDEGIITGTTGEAEAPGRNGGNFGPPAVVPPTLEREQTGQHVEIDVIAHDVSNDVAFWIDYEGQPTLVVTARDTRDGDDRVTGQPPQHGVAPVKRGQHVRLAGTLLPLPHAEGMFSWGLTNHDTALLRQRPVFIHADRITPQ